MKRFFVLCSLGFVLLFASCKSQTAAKYNNTIVGYELDLLPHVQSTESRIEGFAAARAWDSMKVVSTGMANRIGDVITKIDKLDVPDVTGGSELKQAADRYFTYMKGIYQGYASVAAQPTEESRNEELERFKKMLTEKDNVVRTYQAAILKFGKANNVRIEPAKTK